MKWENYEHEDVFAAERKAYPREQYEADRAKLIAEGVDPRLIMSYIGTLSLMAWEAEQEREAEIWESYDEAMAELEREEAEREIAAEVAERDEIIELAEMAEEAAMAELGAFGFVEPPEDFEELGEFAMADSWVNFLEAEFDNGRIGGAELAEYDECLTALYSMLG